MDEREPIEARDKLIAAGEKLFAQRGLAGVSIRELAREAGTNSALISYYFGGKDGLYEAVLERQFAPIASLLETVADLDMTPPDRIIHYARSVPGIHKSRPYLTKYLMREIFSPSQQFEPFIRKYVQRVYSFLHRAIREGAARGEFRGDLDPEAATLALVGMLNFYYIARPIRQHFLADGAERERDERYVLDAVNIFLDGVKRYENEP